MAAKRKAGKGARVSRAGTELQMVETLHRIWLAGLGAVSKAQHGAPQLLEELIEEGAQVDAQARSAAKKAVDDVLGTMQKHVSSRIGQVRGRTSEALDNLEKMFQVRVHRALTQLGVPSSEEIEALSKRVDTLNASIDKLARTQTRAKRAVPRATAVGKRELAAHAAS
jgi:poly(hydroxyalkanoate) granule-associated protein